MTPSDAETIASFITSHLTFIDGGSWEDLSVREDPRWGDTALAPIAALVGHVSKIRYVGGYAGRPSKLDRRVTQVRVVVFTDTQIIRAEAETDPNVPSLFLQRAKVWAIRRDAVQAVSVTRVSHTDDSAAEIWPRLLELEILLADQSTIELPLNPETFNRDYEGLQKLAEELLAPSA